MLKKVVRHCVATALASSVLPVPGGPYSSTPFQGASSPVNSSGYLHHAPTTSLGQQAAIQQPPEKGFLVGGGTGGVESGGRAHGVVGGAMDTQSTGRRLNTSACLLLSGLGHWLLGPKPLPANQIIISLTAGRHIYIPYGQDHCLLQQALGLLQAGDVLPAHVGALGEDVAGQRLRCAPGRQASQGGGRGHSTQVPSMSMVMWGWVRAPQAEGASVAPGLI